MGHDMVFISFRISLEIHCTNTFHFINHRQLRVFREKSSFFGNKTLDQSSGANVFFEKICSKFLAFLAFLQKNAENDHFDQHWSAQHPNAGQNIQYTTHVKLT